MDLMRAHAYTVPPGRLGGERPSGVGLRLTDQVRATLGTALADVPEERQIQVAFRPELDPGANRDNVVRRLLLTYALGTADEADAAAATLADRLCDATDQRSNPCLMILSAAGDGDTRRVAIWTFPQEAAFRFDPGRSVIQLLEDVFSQRSDLRKAASFEGLDRRDSFQIGWVVDLQAGGASVSVADYWIRRFLDCELSITGRTGTRVLVRALRQATDAVQDPDAREQLVAAAAHLPLGPRGRMSLVDVAEQYLDGAARHAFEQAWPNQTLARTPFELDRTVVREAIRVQVFDLDTGVRVSAPPEAVGQSVRIEGETLTVTGVIVSRRLRSR